MRVELGIWVPEAGILLGCRRWGLPEAGMWLGFLDHVCEVVDIIAVAVTDIIAVAVTETVTVVILFL